MGANRKLATPEAYPAIFLRAVENKGAVIYAQDLPWTTISAAKRFRLFLALVKGLPQHRLYPGAKLRWSVQATSKALVLTAYEPGERALVSARSGELIGAALKIGENP